MQHLSDLDYLDKVIYIIGKKMAAGQ